MLRPTVPARVPVPVPTVELWIGLIWWTVGATAFDAGPGTAVLAAGLVALAWLCPAVRRAHGTGVPLPRGGRGELLRRAGVTAGLIVALSMALALLGSVGLVGYGELAVPSGCVLVGYAVLRSAGVLGSRSTRAVGAALVALGLAGGLLALNTPGELYGRGLVGLGAGALLWLGGAYRTGMLGELRTRIGR